MYIEPAREGELRRVLSRFFGEGLATDIRRIDRTRSSGASYLMKYIRPHIKDAAESPTDDAGDDAKSGKRVRYDAHRATWGARSVQFYDVPGSATLWDELRRIKQGSEAHRHLGDRGRALHAAAIETRYADFLGHLMDLSHESEECRSRVVYDIAESGSRRVIGVAIGGAVIKTRTTAWTVVALTKGQRETSRAVPDS
jgi:hypothetical protein